MVSEYAIYTYFAQARSRGFLASGSLQTGWHGRFKGRMRDYHFYMDIDEEWVYIQCPILQTSARRECKAALYKYLLRANDRMFLAKFVMFEAVDDNRTIDWVGITSELPIDCLNAGMFRMMTEAIATYAEEYDREIQAIALEKEVAALIEEQEFNHSD